MNIEYRQEGDVLLPNIKLEEPEGDIGKSGRMRKRFLKEHHRAEYYALIMDMKLKEHLMEINEAANERMDVLEEQLKKQQGVTEALKGQDQMEWVRRMNNIRNQAEEIVLNEIVYQ